MPILCDDNGFHIIFDRGDILVISGIAKEKGKGGRILLKQMKKSLGIGNLRGKEDQIEVDERFPIINLHFENLDSLKVIKRAVDNILENWNKGEIDGKEE